MAHNIMLTIGLDSRDLKFTVKAFHLAHTMSVFQLGGLAFYSSTSGARNTRIDGHIIESSQADLNMWFKSLAMAYKREYGSSLPIDGITQNALILGGKSIPFMHLSSTDVANAQNYFNAWQTFAYNNAIDTLCVCHRANSLFAILMHSRPDMFKVIYCSGCAATYANLTNTAAIKGLDLRMSGLQAYANTYWARHRAHALTRDTATNGYDTYIITPWEAVVGKAYENINNSLSIDLDQISVTTMDVQTSGEWQHPQSAVSNPLSDWVKWAGDLGLASVNGIKCTWTSLLCSENSHFWGLSAIWITIGTKNEESIAHVNERLKNTAQRVQELGYVDRLFVPATQLSEKFTVISPMTTVAVNQATSLGTDVHSIVRLCLLADVDNIINTYMANCFSYIQFLWSW